MTDQTGWRPLEKPRARREARGSFTLSPFARLARTHACLVSGDTLVALALAGSLFFSIDPSAARWRVGLYLLLTMAPFAVVAPLIGPALDRVAGGRRMMVIGSGALRCVLALVMARHLDSLLLFPEAFTMLVLGKGYHVAKSSLVPGTVRTDEELVEANSKLSLLSGISGAVIVVPGGLAMLLGGAPAVCVLAAIVFGAGAVMGLRMKAEAVSTEPTEVERSELRGGGIRLAASAMGLLRGIVGFLTFLIAFTLRGTVEQPYVEEFGSQVGAATREAIGMASTTVSTGAPTWHFGVAAAMAGIGGPVGALVTPRLRRTVKEEQILVGSILLLVAVGVAAAILGGLVGAALIALTVSFSAGAGKLAFDSIVQRDAPDADRGRSFARFETRFQLIWVVGAALPVVVAMPGRIGYLLIAGTAAFAAVSYVLGYRFLEAHGRLRPRRTPDVTGKLKEEASRRARRVRRSATRRLRREGGIVPGTVPEEQPPPSGDGSDVVR
ncbi:MFS transporter [Actinomarinicola tropica]|uniref:MFS transporter n=1 Tax=Actinomarinicola tropica TaxID=2789776 RepID=A0A5Q2RGM6_9ACTN|nr:MFS transporter [Actinomarinicola tropica]QGG93972.1 MFS transporter [Actinomarinicola tropica]